MRIIRSVLLIILIRKSFGESLILSLGLVLRKELLGHSMCLLLRLLVFSAKLPSRKGSSCQQ